MVLFEFILLYSGWAVETAEPNLGTLERMYLGGESRLLLSAGAAQILPCPFQGPQTLLGPGQQHQPVQGWLGLSSF